MEENSERNYKRTEEDNRLLILILVASFIIISMIIIIGSTACILLCFEGSIEEKEEEIQEALSKLTEKKRKGQKRQGKQQNQNTVLISKTNEWKTGVEGDAPTNSTNSIKAADNSDVSRAPPPQEEPGTVESCLLEQLRVSDNWRHLVNVEQGGQIKLNLREQVSAKL